VQNASGGLGTWQPGGPDENALIFYAEKYEIGNRALVAAPIKN